MFKKIHGINVYRKKVEPINGFNIFYYTLA
jgi:hypothetical protein